jgi:crossover junction endodeoxyribonuclease RusA
VSPAGSTRSPCLRRVEIAANQPDNRRRDLDNYLKAPLDALMSAGVYEDDSQIVDLRIYWTEEKGKTIKITLRDA